MNVTLALQAGGSNIPSEVLYLLKSVRYIGGVSQKLCEGEHKAEYFEVRGARK